MTQQNIEDMEFTKASFTTIMSHIEERMSNFEAELQKSTRAASNSPSLTSLASDFTSFKQFVFETMNAFRQQAELLAHQVDSIEMRSRRKMLLLHGVPEKKTEDLPQILTDVFKNQLKMTEFTLDDIRRCHRMGRPTAGNKPRTIAVKLERVTVRDKIWFSKSKLKGSGKTLSEFLTKPRHELFMAARDRLGVSKCWTREGQIYVLDPNGSSRRITSLIELNQLNLGTQKATAATKPVAAKSRRAISNKK